MAERADIHLHDLDHDIVLGHKFRYFLARGFLRPFDRVMDIACGTGYGSQILAATEHVHVTAIDHSRGALSIANKLYTNPNISFVSEDLCTWNPTPEMCDVMVCLETIEHLKIKPEEFAKKLKTATARTIVVSAPIIPTKHKNIFHVHDLTDEQMVKMFVDKEWMLYEKVTQRVYGLYVFVKISELTKVI